MTDDVRVEWLTIGGSPEGWQRLGLTVTAEGVVPFLFTSLRVVDAEPGIRSWALSGIDRSIDSIDGLATEVVEPVLPALADHPNGAIELDHLVVLTNSVERTSAAIADATASPLKRVREVGTMRQGFHRLGRGGLIVELVERPEVADDGASFWGLVINVAELETTVDRLGSDVIGAAKDAVQPGRRIATVRQEVGLGLPVALMSPTLR